MSSIIIREKASGKILDIPSPFALENKNTSPVFNTLGSKTISTDILASPHNLRIFGFPDRIDIDRKPKVKMPVIVSEGSYSREGVLYLSTSARSARSLNITIAFNEGIMYEAMDNLSLPDIKSPIRIFSNFDDIMVYLNRLFTESGADEELSVFPVYLKREKYTEEFEGNSFEYDKWVSLNVPTSYTDSRLSVIYETEVVVNGELVHTRVPTGYGITPFLRVWRLLELIFEHFGYTVNENPFKEHFQLKRLCVLNNVPDSIIFNEINYSQLMPNVSIMDFLNSLYCRFGMKVFFDGGKNEVNLRLLKDIFSSSADKKLDLRADPDIDYTTPKQVKLSCGKNLDLSDTETETYEEFLAKYNNTVDIAFNNLGEQHTGIAFYQLSGQFYQRPQAGKEKRISSIHFDYNKKEDGYEIEEIVSVDEALSMESSLSYIIYYAVEPNLQNSSMSVQTTTTGGDRNSNLLDIMSGENKLSFAYDMDELYYNIDGVRVSRGHKFGSIFPYAASSNAVEYQEDRDGNTFVYALTLVGKDGAFNHFFREYDAFLRHSNNVLKTTINARAFELSSIDISKKWIVNNQPVLLDKVDYNLGMNNSTIGTTIEARTLHLYKPYDLEKEQAIPSPIPILYKWLMNLNRDIILFMKKLELSDKYKDTRPPNAEEDLPYSFDSCELESFEDPSPPSDFNLWILPPTQQQFDDETEINRYFHPITATFLIKYKIYLGQGAGGWVEKTYRDVQEMEYESYYFPTKINI